MRIISGEYGGRRFDAPKNMQARPTTDLAKGALFNILQNRMDLEDCVALDLFGGTGSISFELLSRGAAQVTCVEMGRVQQQFITEVAQKLKCADHLRLVRGDVFRFLSSAPVKVEGIYDFIFADPPYALDKLASLPSLILPLLKPDSIFVLEHGDEHDFSAVPGFQELRVYGAVHFSFFART